MSDGANGSTRGFLGSLEAADLAALHAVLVRRRYKTGEEVIAREEEGRSVYFVLTGEAVVTLISRDGRLIAYRDIGLGDVFGELAALTGAPRSASVNAAGDLEVGVLEEAAFLRLARTMPGFGLALARHLAIMVRDLTERVFEHSTMLVRQRLARELLRRGRDGAAGGDHARISPAPTHSALAAHISTHREAVTKELSALAAAGLIRKGRGSIEVPSLAALEAWADGAG